VLRGFANLLLSGDQAHPLLPLFQQTRASLGLELFPAAASRHRQCHIEDGITSSCLSGCRSARNLNPLQSDPRFQKTLKGMGIPLDSSFPPRSLAGMCLPSCQNPFYSVYGAKVGSAPPAQNPPAYYSICSIRQIQGPKYGWRKLMLNPGRGRNPTRAS
jgi:hypothetical protein